MSPFIDAEIITRTVPTAATSGLAALLLFLGELVRRNLLTMRAAVFGVVVVTFLGIANSAHAYDWPDGTWGLAGGNANGPLGTQSFPYGMGATPTAAYTAWLAGVNAAVEGVGNRATVFGSCTVPSVGSPTASGTSSCTRCLDGFCLTDTVFIQCSAGTTLKPGNPYQCTTVNGCSAGTDGGPQKIGVGWADGPASTSNWVSYNVPSSACSGGCKVAVGKNQQGSCVGGETGFMCQSPTPNASGLYPVYGFYQSIQTGEECSDPTPNGTPSGGACPGQSGTVNGVPTCIPSSTSAGATSSTTTGAPTTNPNGSTSQTSTTTTSNGDGSTTTSTTTTTTTAGGGSTSSTTTSTSGGGAPTKGGTSGTGGTVGQTSGTGSGSSNVTVNVDTCGKPGQPKCQIDESGTPGGEGAYGTAGTALGTAMDGKGEGLSSVTSSTGKDVSWGWLPSLNSGACPTLGGMSIEGISVSFGAQLCSYSDLIKGIMTFLWVTFTWTTCASMVKRTMDGN